MSSEFPEFLLRKNQPSGPEVPYGDEEPLSHLVKMAQNGNESGRYADVKNKLFTPPPPAQEESVQATYEAPTLEPGPFSSLFNYEEEVKRQEEMTARRKAIDEKLMRGNAIVDGINLLIQGLGANAGATIKKQAPNASVLKAFDDYMALDREKKEALDRFRMFDLQNKTRDLTRQHQLDDREDTQAHQIGMWESGQEAQIEKEERDNAFKSSEAEKAREGRYRQSEMEADKRKELYGGYYSNYAGRSTKNSALKMSMGGKEYEITDGVAAAIIDELDKLYPKGNPERSRVIDEALRNKNIQDVSLGVQIRRNWPHLVQNIPELKQLVESGQIPLNPTEEATPAQTGESGNETSSYDKAIAETVSNTALSYRKKMKFIRDVAMEGYGYDKTQAENFAKEILR